MTGDVGSRAIVEAALRLAEEVGWDRVRLHVVADRLGMPLTDVLERFRDLDAVADAWFLQAWHSMLTPAEGEAELPPRLRVFAALMRWFDALAVHRDVTRAMLAAKFYPLHPHHWGPTLFHLSRSIQWLREVARLDAAGPRRQAEEIALTGLFLATLATWLCDDSPGQRRTRAALRRRLDRLYRLSRFTATWRTGDCPAALHKE